MALSRRTNVEMLRTIKDWYPKERYVVSKEECWYIRNMLELDEMTIRDLRNMRDTIVLNFEIIIGDSIAPKDYTRELDRMSALTSIIDEKLFKLGAEI